MCTLYVLQLMKKHILGRSDIEQWRNQACSHIFCWVWLKVSASEWVRSELVSIKFWLSRKFLKFHKNLLEGFKVVTLRHFWTWLSLTNTPKLFWRNIEAGFWVIFGLQKPYSSQSLIYIYTVWFKHPNTIFVFNFLQSSSIFNLSVWIHQIFKPGRCWLWVHI